MFDSNSAVERIKNHLAYKLGQAMIDFKQNGGGYIALFKKFYKIKKQHKKEQKIYQQTIQVFPQLKYPSLEKCSDYEQALRYKFHLSYMLGEVLIKAYQNWYKGAGFKLKNNIKKANKEFQIFREIFKEFDQINSSILEGLIDNKQLFLKEFPRIKNILKIHQDYKAILDNIFHNFNYFIQNFDLIEEWLLSDDFKERYKKENHPYPSLLNPKKLNDETEDINYNNIPAELAWEMNLPLPDRYKFVLIAPHASGQNALRRFLEYTDLNKYFYKILSDGLARYKAIYYVNNTYISCTEVNFKYSDKFYNMIQNNVGIVRLVRDPISTIKSVVTTFRPFKDKKNQINNFSNLNEIFSQIKFGLGGLDKPNVNDTGKFINDTFSQHTFMKPEGSYIGYLCLKYLKFNKIIYVDFEELNPEMSYKTILKLSNIFNFKINKPSNFFNQRVYGALTLIFPLELIYNYFNKDINFLITSRFQFMHLPDSHIKNRIYNLNSILGVNQTLDIYVNKEDYKYIQTINIKDIKKYFKFFLDCLHNTLDKLEKLKLSEKDILSFLIQRQEYRLKLKEILDKELQIIKEHRPDIVASWKYYQEFEQMCKELDDDIQEKDFVN
ncbi:DUF2972 domain-containing protein [Campylobacter jejuni]|nr:DUF2972 domain-containing protein [Campylobacter jejuni]EAH5290381.1 DUF2972 domain-containing protein [Campylobacter jejuni]EAH7260502.1 DUF2972 domain-containing protein [Campylobacter jejuni]EAH8411199.1 DUF2972 domain-containing protein [Campylobacter jejuni]EAH9534288.1 DUF2972 domain-containing protein [Campylobacter jejuni]